MLERCLEGVDQMPDACRMREGRFLAFFPLHLCIVVYYLSNFRPCKCFAVVHV